MLTTIHTEYNGQQGFTLLEIAVAVAIMLLIGGVTAIMLSSPLKEAKLAVESAKSGKTVAEQTIQAASAPLLESQDIQIGDGWIGAAILVLVVGGICLGIGLVSHHITTGYLLDVEEFFESLDVAPTSERRGSQSDSENLHDLAVASAPPQLMGPKWKKRTRRKVIEK